MPTIYWKSSVVDTDRRLLFSVTSYIAYKWRKGAGSYNNLHKSYGDHWKSTPVHQTEIQLHLVIPFDSSLYQEFSGERTLRLVLKAEWSLLLIAFCRSKITVRV